MSSCARCGAAVAYLVRIGLGTAVACDPATVHEGETVFIRGLHMEHICAAPEKPTGQRGLFGGEE